MWEVGTIMVADGVVDPMVAVVVAKAEMAAGLIQTSKVHWGMLFLGQ